MEIAKQYEEDGYKITEYTNGAIIKEIIGEEIEETPEVLEEDLSTGDFQTKMLLDMEYLKCLAEINGGI